jgi:hypothetical protein
MTFSVSEGYNAYLLDTVALCTFKETSRSVKDTLEVLLSFKVCKEKEEICIFTNFYFQSRRI